tara:strand:+ start:193 stop:894 length:702 start_codon:yes stop_codon:yes gene_type:complete
MHKNFSAMILSAGFGKRLLPLTTNIPKPLIEVNSISLLSNSINFLLKIGCKKIVINTHFKHELILKFINKNFKNENILISYEDEILDTAGGVKKALPLFDDESILITNSDVFWIKNNEEDIINFINNYQYRDECKLLLVNKNNTRGIINKTGDFTLKNNLLSRWKKGEQILYYSGLQIINLEILNRYKKNKFSFNLVWDDQISSNNLRGIVMNSKLYHIGDILGLKQACEETA